MKFSTLAIPAVFATLAYATCFTGGASGVAANVQGALPTVCAALAGFFVKNEQRHMCVTDAAQVQWDFTLEYIGSNGNRQISTPECQNGFTKETDCGHGGSSAYTNWRYTADPNAGSCLGVVF